MERPHKAEATLNKASANKKTQPSRHRDDDRKTDHISDHYRIKGVGRDTQLTSDRGQSHIHNRRIHDRHEQGRDEDNTHTDFRVELKMMHKSGSPGNFKTQIQ